MVFSLLRNNGAGGVEQYVYECRVFVFDISHRIDEVWAVETHAKHIVRLKLQFVLYVSHHSRCGRGCECQNGCFGLQFAQQRYLQV